MHKEAIVPVGTPCPSVVPGQIFFFDSNFFLNIFKAAALDLKLAWVVKLGGPDF